MNLRARFDRSRAHQLRKSERIGKRIVVRGVLIGSLIMLKVHGASWLLWEKR
jgi:hypothetical protein